MPLVVRHPLTALWGWWSTLDFLRDGCCADRQRHLVIDEGEFRGWEYTPWRGDTGGVYGPSAYQWYL